MKKIITSLINLIKINLYLRYRKFFPISTVSLIFKPLFLDEEKLLFFYSKLNLKEKLYLAGDSFSSATTLHFLSYKETNPQILQMVIINPNTANETLWSILEKDTDGEMKDFISEKRVFSSGYENPEQTFKIIANLDLSEYNKYSFRIFLATTNNKEYLEEFYRICSNHLDNVTLKFRMERAIEYIAKNHNLPSSISEDIFLKKIAIKELLKNRSFKESDIFKVASILKII